MKLTRDCGYDEKESIKTKCTVAGHGKHTEITKRCQSALQFWLNIRSPIYMRPADERPTRVSECALIWHNQSLIDHMAPKQRFDEIITGHSLHIGVPRYSGQSAAAAVYLDRCHQRGSIAVTHPQ